MVNTLGTLRGAQTSGLLDVISYLAGVSGSCWCFNMLYSIGHGNLDQLSKHIEARITVPFLHPSTLDLLTSPPTNKYLLSGLLIKDAGKGGDTTLVDAYGTLVSSRLFVPADLTVLDPRHLKISNQRQFVENGRWPMPIYSIIRHDVPEAGRIASLEKDIIEERHSNKKGSDAVAKERKAEKEGLVAKASWQWFEMSPFEVGLVRCMPFCMLGTDVTTMLRLDPKR